MPSDQSKTFFKYNIFFWNVFGIWGGRRPSKYYKIYTYTYLFISCFSYNALLIVNLLYTPLKVDTLVRELIFFCTAITVMAKVFTVLLLRDKIIEVFDIMDCDEFVGDYKTKGGVIDKMNKTYIFCFKILAIGSNMLYCLKIFVALLFELMRGGEMELPICKYYFLSDETRHNHFPFLYFYQSFGIYGQMMYNVNIDSFIGGMLLIATNHLRLLNMHLSKFTLSKEESKLSKEKQDMIAMGKLKELLKYYDLILKYSKTIQDILNIVAFFQFGAASIIICVIMCGLSLPGTIDTKIFMVMFFFTMSSQILVPAYLGTQLTHESKEIVNAAYDGEWISRTNSFKKMLRLLMNRAMTPITITGLKMFPLSLVTFTSIMKLAYSFFTLISNFQE